MEMNKKITIVTVLFTLCVCIMLGGCANHPNHALTEIQSEIPTAEAEVAVEETKKETTETSKSTDIYDAVLAEYADMVQNNFYTDALENEDLDTYDASFGEDIGFEIRARVQNIFYALADIDQNGVQELIIAASDTNVTNSGNSPWYYDIYTYNGTKAVHLFPDYEFGYRTNFKLMENGIIQINGSYSAAESGCEFYRIGSDGITPELVEAFSMVGSMKDDVVTFVYYNNTDEITEQDYQTRISNYGEEITTSLEWILIQ